MKHRIKILLLAVLIAALCNCMLMIGMTKTKEKNTIPKDASLICEETVSPNKDYITDEKDLVNYTVRVYQEKNNDIIVYAESNSPLFDEAQYIVICDHASNFHADHRIGNQVNTQNEVDESSYDIPPPARDTFPVAKSKDDFQNTAYQHRYTENDT